MKDTLLTVVQRIQSCDILYLKESPSRSLCIMWFAVNLIYHGMIYLTCAEALGL